MGKKGVKKGKIDKIVESAEPNLSTIIEEDVPEKTDTDEPKKIPDGTDAPLSHSLETAISTKDDKETQIETDGAPGSRSTSEKNSESKTEPELDVADQPEKLQIDEPVEVNVEVDTQVEYKKKKGKTRKKEKLEVTEDESEEKQPKKGKKNKKKLAVDDNESGEAEKQPIKGKKNKKPKSITEEELQPETSQHDVTPSTEDKEQITNDIVEQPKNKKKGKKIKEQNLDEIKIELQEKPKVKKVKKNSSEEENKKVSETKKKGKKGKKDKQDEKGEITSDMLTSQTGILKQQREEEFESKSKRKSTVSIVEEKRSNDSIKKKKRHRKGDHKSRSAELVKSKVSVSSTESADLSLKRSSSIIRSGSMQASAQIRKMYSKMSAASIDTSSVAETEEGKKDEKPTKKKGRTKKDKAQQKDDGVEETEEEKERKRAEKEAEKQAKKEAKKAAKKEALAKKRAEKAAEKATSGDHDDVKKRLDELKRIVKEMGIDEHKLIDTEAPEEGPKKKASKKEKTKLTAEMAEKAKAEMEAQVKRLEEVIRKRKEEERLAAIEKDKKEIVEQTMRLEQLQETADLIQEIIDINAEITKEEKDLQEWNKYVECGKLPNPALCNQMNTYLHLWELDLKQTSISDASRRTDDAIKLLNDLDELIDTVVIDESHKLDNWKWVRQLFRGYQATTLDVVTYQLLRDVNRNLNRINIPTADFNFKDDHITLCLWLRVMLPIPLPNPRRPPKPKIDISFDQMNLSAAFPLTIDCENAAIRAMYLKYDHLSDLSSTFNMPDVPEDYCKDLLTICKKEWRAKLKYKYDNRDRIIQKLQVVDAESQEQDDPSKATVQPEELKTEEKPITGEKGKITFEEPEIGSDDEIPEVPFKQLKPTASEQAILLEDALYDETREKLRLEVPDNVINLRKFVVLGGVFHLNLLAQPPQPQDFVTMEMTITGLYLPKKLEFLPFKVVYTPYIPPEPEPNDSNTNIRKLPEELEEEMKKQEEELDKLILINMKWPSHVIFLELPVVCRWDEEKKHWSNEEIYDIKHNEDKCMLSFRTGVFGIYGLAAYRYSNLPFQAYDIKPELDDSVTVQLTAAILMLEFNIKDGLIAITQLQNSPNMTLQDVVGKYMKLHRLKRIMKEAGIDIFPAFDAFCYIDGCCEKQWAMEKHLYYNIAQISNCFNFAWSRWNLQAGRRKIVLQMRQYSTDKGKQKNHQMLLVTPLKATFIECTEVSQAFSEKEVESLKFCADLYHLMKITNGIFVRNKVSKASKQNVYTLAQFLISIRVLSFS